MTSEQPQEPSTEQPLERVGVVVHPNRDIEGPLQDLFRWAKGAGIDVGQVPLHRHDREIADVLAAEDADLIVAIGGDGTTLAAIRSAAPSDRPVLGVTCGSLGVLTGVPAEETTEALERFRGGDWSVRELPALEVRAEGEDGRHAEALAFNDVVVGRAGEGQVRVAARVDGELYARLAGDGCIVSTPLGSSAYTLAAGGPLLPLEIKAYLLTSLPAHGGFRPPLVLCADQQLTLQSAGGFGGIRLEIDGQLSDLPPERLTFAVREAAARVVVLGGQETLVAGLRRRGIISDSPRIVAEEARASEEQRARAAKRTSEEQRETDAQPERDSR